MSTCAVVGNSRILLGSNLGGVIDGHDHVVRFNIAKIGGFENHVGSKCTMRFSNLHPVACHLSKSHLEEHMRMFPEYDNNAILEWSNQELYFKDARMIEGTNLMSHLLSRGNSIKHIPSNIVSELRGFLGKEPTMGIVAITMLVQVFDFLDCYGFDFYEAAGDFHYFEKTISYQGCHDTDKEKSLAMFLQDTGRIKIHK